MTPEQKEFDDKLGDALTEVTQQVTSGKKDINRNFLPIYEAAQKLHDLWPTLCELGNIPPWPYIALKDYQETDEEVDRHNEEGIIKLSESLANARPTISKAVGGGDE